MKSWFTRLAQFKISNALDDASGSPPDSPLSSPEEAGFARTVAMLDAELKLQRPKLQAPSQLHRTIMHAISAAEAHRQESPYRRLRWPTTAAACLAVALAALFWFPRQPAGDGSATHSLNAAATAFEIGTAIPPVITAEAVAPLSLELQRVNQDLNNLTHFLLAHLP